MGAARERPDLFSGSIQRFISHVVKRRFDPSFIDPSSPALRAVSQSGIGFVDDRNQIVGSQWELKEEALVEIIDAQEWSDEELAKLEEKEPKKPASQR